MCFCRSSQDGGSKDSLVEMTSCLADESVADIPFGETFQAERIGYFCKDSDNSGKVKYILDKLLVYLARSTSNDAK